jgi:coiled-coil domain-containing protein 130
MPYDVWCEGCGNHVAKGVRFNAEKQCVGKYLSTRIFRFTMKCHLCSNRFEIETDPKNTDYVCVSGLRKKVEEWTPQPEDHVAQLVTPEEQYRLQEDPFYRLEHAREDQQRAREEAPRIEQLLQLREERSRDDFAANSLLRKRLREEKAAARARLEDGQRLGLNLELLPAATQDAQLARLALQHRKPAAPLASPAASVRQQSAFGGGAAKLELLQRAKRFKSAALLSAPERTPLRVDRLPVPTPRLSVLPRPSTPPPSSTASTSNPASS